MTQIATHARGFAVTIWISIVIAMIPSGANGFSVHAQTACIPLHHTHDSTSGGAKILAGKHGISHGTFESPSSARPMASTALSAAALPGLGSFAAAAFLPTCLGLWRTGYAVSYGYGGAMLASGLVQLTAALRGEPMLLPVQLHAALYVFYGVRLCAFLLHREIAFPVEIHQMKRRDSSLPERLKRLPVVTGCSVLYFCMAAAPMRILSLLTRATETENAATMTLLGVGFAGFVLAGVGDWYKARIKMRDGPDKLVTTGPFRYLRHPNYTGDMLGWTCACLLLPLLTTGTNLRRVLPWVASSVLGWAGIFFAVYGSDATAGLEKKQKEKYGGTPEYEEWIKRSWSGPMVVGGDK